MKFKGSFVLLLLPAIFLFFSCTKVNEPTELGGDLIPAVDNVNTFDTTLEVQAAYFPFNDTSRHTLTDNMALGQLNDPEFGTTKASIYFNFSSPVYGSNAFVHKDSVKAIDSVVLSLGYQGAYGDTSTSQVTVEVSEVLSGNGVRDDSSYRNTTPGFSSGPTLATRTFSIRDIKDSVRVVRKGDTTKSANAIRIKLNNNNLGDRLRLFDTSSTSSNAGYYSDSAFRALFRGLAIKTTNATGAGVLAYVNLADPKTRLIVYYKAGRSTGIDSGASVSFSPTISFASKNLHANSVIRTPSGNYVTNLAKASAQTLYVQSAPSGSYVSIFVPTLTGFPNKVIHRAELIATAVPSLNDDVLKKPNILFLGHKSTTDSIFVFEKDLVPSFDGSLNFTAFGGLAQTDNSYHFNITRYVQGIVTRGDRNDSLILYAPYIARVFTGTIPQGITNILSGIGAGRVVIANNNYFDRNKRLRLRIVYSNL